MTAAAPAYTALARRYRPQTFAEVIGQDHVGQALRNALRKDRVAHAYLFTGARGVGKTSTARIFAKALNCPNAVDHVPCNECDICHGISVGQDMDVSEIDAASNRGIDDIRQLRANVTLRPMRSRHKIYIIDEAHQLSKDAWNALLKTLEEPPPNVKFFFCTTEPNKLPDTILSRCQRFDFSTVESTDIVGRLSQIAAAEGFTAEPAALDLVARRAAGSMRDSQSLFDQLLAFGGEAITAGDVHRLFGTADDERLIGLGSSLADRQPGEALAKLSAALDAGVQVGELFDQLIAYFRDLMVLAAGAEGVSLLSVAEDRREVLAGQAGRFGLHTLLAATQILSDARGRMVRVSFPRPLGELALARVAVLNDLDELADLIAAVRSGAGRGAAAARRVAPTGIASPTPAAGGTPHPPDAPRPTWTPQKKSNGTAPVSELTANPGAQTPIAAAEPERPAVPRVAFTPGSETALVASLRDHLGPGAAGPLLGVSRGAISGPNALELFFPKDYTVARQMCEGSGRGRIEAALAELTGQPVRLTCRLDESAPAADAAPAVRTPRVEVRRVSEEAVDDPFVRKAMGVFEVKEATVRPLGGPAGE